MRGWPHCRTTIRSTEAFQQMIDHINHLGKLVHECGLPGETRADLVAPAHPNGMQLSKNRFLILNATLGFRSVDDSLSTTWQLRKDAYDGPVIKEGFFSQTTNAWDPLGLGVTWKKETGAMTGFGVPKGALINGKCVGHENVFAVKYRTCGRIYNPEGDYIKWWANDDPDIWRSHRVFWTQFRLNDTEDDLEILQRDQPLTQLGYEPWGLFCERDVANLNQTFAEVWPVNDDCREWVDLHHGSTGNHTVMNLFTSKYRFNSRTRLYEWTDCGPHMGDGAYESSILPYKDDWLIAARHHGHRKARPGVSWTRLSDPFSQPEKWTTPPDVRSCNAPITAYQCPDGIPRLLSGDGSLSPYADRSNPMKWIDNRNPLYMWDIDPEAGFRATQTHLIYDMVADGIPISREHGPVSDMGKILPHPGGKEQVVIHRLRSCSLRCREPWEALKHIVDHRLPYLTDDDFDATGIYYAKIHYHEEYPSYWSFME